MAQAVHAFDLNMRIVFWNAMAEKLCGYSAALGWGESISVAVGRDTTFSVNIARRCVRGRLTTLKAQEGESSTILSEGGSGDSHQSDHSVFGATHSDHRDDAASSGASGILMSVMMRRERGFPSLQTDAVSTRKQILLYTLGFMTTSH
ncbi:hypothetical protein Bca52824_089620 [Brassica carinata]|uniref:PAS domain-containing protein n=1 Tax=Brassica carinata TaxID=52824 RepID=A0A8X7TPY2_BRACI|nr:hypothetical protein Bca52824_089620 [Brassica carinata]